MKLYQPYHLLNKKEELTKNKILWKKIKENFWQNLKQNLKEKLLVFLNLRKKIVKIKNFYFFHVPYNTYWMAMTFKFYFYSKKNGIKPTEKQQLVGLDRQDNSIYCQHSAVITISWP